MKDKSSLKKKSAEGVKVNSHKNHHGTTITRTISVIDISSNSSNNDDDDDDDDHSTNDNNFKDNDDYNDDNNNNNDDNVVNKQIDNYTSCNNGKNWDIGGSKQGDRRVSEMMKEPRGALFYMSRNNSRSSLSSSNNLRSNPQQSVSPSSLDEVEVGKSSNNKIDNNNPTTTMTTHSQDSQNNISETSNNNNSPTTNPLSYNSSNGRKSNVINDNINSINITTRNGLKHKRVQSTSSLSRTSALEPPTRNLHPPDTLTTSHNSNSAEASRFNSH